MTENHSTSPRLENGITYVVLGAALGSFLVALIIAQISEQPVLPVWGMIFMLLFLVVFLPALLLYVLYNGTRQFGRNVQEETRINAIVKHVVPEQASPPRMFLQWIKVIILLVGWLLLLMGGVYLEFKAVLALAHLWHHSAAWSGVIFILLVGLSFALMNCLSDLWNRKFSLKTLLNGLSTFIFVVGAIELAIPFVASLNSWLPLMLTINLPRIILYSAITVQIERNIMQAQFRRAYKLVEVANYMPAVLQTDYTLGTLDLFAGNYSAAQAKLYTFLKTPRNVKETCSALQNLAYAWLGMGEFEAAERALQAAIELEPKRGEHKSALVDVYLTGNFGSPIELTEAAVQTIQDQRYAGEMWATHAWALAEAGSREEAQAAIQTALENLPRKFNVYMAATYYKLGRAWEALSNSEAARSHFSLALNYDSEGAIAGRVQEQLGG